MPSSFIILLSAKNEDRLLEYAKAMLKAFRQGRYTEAQLPGIAYTLQTGREAMEERLAFSVTSISELVTALEGFISGAKASPNTFTGKAKDYKESMAAFMNEAEMTTMTDTWLLNGKYDQLMAAWCKGFPMDWESLYINEAGEPDLPRRVSLPGYPFDRKRYWISEQHTGTLTHMATVPAATVKTEDTKNKPAPTREEEPFKLMTFEEVWQEKKIEPAPASVKTLLCFASNQEHQQQILAAMKTLNAATKVVFLAVQERTANFQTIFSRMAQEHGAIGAILYLWPIENPSLLQDYDTIVAILQAIGAAKIPTRHILLAAAWQQQRDTMNIQRCYAESWIGFERSLNLILPGVQLKAVYEEADQPAAMTAWTNRLWAELNSNEKRSALYKNGTRYVLQVKPATIQPGKNILVKGGTYLITGGMGNLGLLFARHLAQNYTARLILTGRSAPDANKQQQLQELELLGGKVFFLQADIGDAAAMRQGLQQATEKFGPVNGVIHAAGTVDSKMLPDKTPQDFQKVLHPKVNGTILLDELLENEPLDFICYFTSASAILGDFGACDYAIANRFQMSFAQSRTQLMQSGHRKGKTIAINWPLWKEGGMDLDEEENTRLYLKSSGQRYLLTEEGIALFEQLIIQQPVQLLVVAGQESKAKRFLGMQTAQEKKPVTPITTAPALTTTKIRSNHSRPGNALEQDLISLVSKAQQIPETDLLPDDNLADIGFDSISLTELARLLSQHYSITIAPAIFFGYSTISKLKEYFLKEQAPVVEAMYGNKQTLVEEPLPTIPRYEPPVEQEPLPSIPLPTVSPAAATRQMPAVQQEPIAIIGMSGRFPAARNVADLWQILSEGKDVVGEIPADRFRWQDYYSADGIAPGKTNCKWSGLMPGIYEFDPAFFGISPKEAELMDPRQRLLIQEAWNALEDAGYGPTQIDKGRVGLFVGAEESGYATATNESGLTASHNAILAARLSYFMNLSGPNMAINTACSSGLVAAHQAFQSLQTGECDTALAAGVNIMFSPALYIGMSQAGMLSDKGKCFVFDKRADGMVPAEAVVVVVLKRLSDALADGDPIYATIEASGINYDGKTNGITAPNGLAQAALFKSVYDRFAINPGHIEYIVSHGTGTRLGDPVEVNALQESFKTYTGRKAFCALTSAKSNIGHSFAASGLVNMVNLIQAFRHEAIPASLHCQEENDYINWQETPFYVNKSRKPWIAAPGKERIGAISAFGMSGTNAHMVLQSYTGEAGMADQEGLLHLLVLSAKTPAALQERAAALAEACEKGGLQDARLTDIAYTLLVGRHHFKYRAACIVRSKAEAIQLLKRMAGKERAAHLFQGEVLRDFKERSSIKKYIATLTEQGGKLNSDQPDWEDDLAALADLYCQGYDIPAVQLYSSLQARRIHLPGYPFAREEYRAGQPAIPTTNNNQPAEKPEPIPAKQEQEDFSLMTFEETWQETAIPSNIAAISVQTLVCFLSGNTNQQIISDRLRQLAPATKLIFVAAGEEEPAASRRDNAFIYWLNGTNEEAYQRVFRNVSREHGQPDAILYLFPLEKAGYNQDYFPLFAMVRAIYTEKIPVKKLILSGSWHTTAGIELPDSCYLQSWTGLERTAKTVIPHTALSCVFHESNNEPPAFDNLFSRLWQELKVPGNQTVLYRANKRWTYQLQEYALSPSGTILKQGATYLITGGCGGLGLIIANHLAATYKANLVLIGRSRMDVQKQTAIQALQELGAQVMYIQADVCREEDMQTALSAVWTRFGNIQGVIHAAGIAGDKTIFNQDFPQFQQVLQPKVQGTILLDQLLERESLDFMCYFSSGTAIIGDFGTCNYAIGNRFQVAYAHYRDQLQRAGRRQGKTVVINWPLWKEGGMHLKEEGITELFLRSSGQRLLTSEEGIKIFEQLLTQQAIQTLVLAGRPTRLRQLLGITATPAHTQYEALPRKSNTPSLRKTAMQAFDIEQCIEYDLKEQVNKLLKIDTSKIDVYDNLVDIGFDSISLTQLAKSLSGYYSLEILPSVFFGYPTIEKLTGFLWNEHRAFMEEIYREETTATTMIAAPVAEETGKLNDTYSESPDASPLPLAGSLPATAEPIAIIGMSGRFAGARDIEEMWTILSAGINAVEEIPKERFDYQLYYQEGNTEAGKTNCKWTGIVPGVDEFDPLFFEIPPRQAAAMDPRQRLLLQEAWKALEDAGYGATQIRQNKIGMYVGAEESSYASLAGNEGNLTSNNNAILAARLSYFLNLSGPNMAINTACSSGLVAVHQACLSLRNFECDTAIAAAVNLLFTPEPYVAMSQAGMLSPDGKCYSFDKRANGMVPGEAVTVVVLKRLSKALADGDPIYATIVGSALNYDGKTNGITAPSGVAQTTLLKSVYDQFQVNPADIEYIVTHGTGTSLGDAVEISALQDAFKHYTPKQAYCALTSSKTNFGHTLASSGIVSMIGLVQSFTHNTIPASLHCTTENDHINWHASPFFVNKKNRPWLPVLGKERTGAVSAFGMSGTNAHIVLQSYTAAQAEDRQHQAPVHLLVLSAKTPAALKDKLNDMIWSMEDGPLTGAAITDIAYTLLAGRHHFRYRCAVLAHNSEEAINGWRQLINEENSPRLFRGELLNDFRQTASIKTQITSLAQQTHTLYSNGQQYQALLSTLAACYCEGYELPADILYVDLKPRRIHLPTYPFAREKYWVKQVLQSNPIPVPQPKAGEPPVVAPAENGHAKKHTNGNGHAKTFQYLTALLSAVTGLPPEIIEEDAQFVNYGIDSILIMQLKNRLEIITGELPTNLFFEYPTIRSLGQYFIHTHPGLLSNTDHQHTPAGELPAGLSIPGNEPYDMPAYIAAIVSEALGIPADKIEPRLRLEFYGVDSILMVQLKNQLEKVFGELPVSLFYDHPTIHELAVYFSDAPAASPLLVTEEQSN